MHRVDVVLNATWPCHLLSIQILELVAVNDEAGCYLLVLLSFVNGGFQALDAFFGVWVGTEELRGSTVTQ